MNPAALRRVRAAAPRMEIEQRGDRLLYIVPDPTQPPHEPLQHADDPFELERRDEQRRMQAFVSWVIYGAGIASAVLLYFVVRV